MSNRFVLGVDVQKYSSRLVRRQVDIQEKLDRMLSRAAEMADLDRATWECHAEGDGEVAILPGGTDLIAPVHRFVGHLDSLLLDHNEDHAAEMRIRLRVAMHTGTVTPGRLGVGGEALITLSRLLNSEPLRDALSANESANLALILSRELFEKAVVPELGGLRPRRFQQAEVDIPAKEFRETAYIFVPLHQDSSATSGASTSAPARGGAPGDSARRTSSVIINGPVHTGGGGVYGGDGV